MERTLLILFLFAVAAGAAVAALVVALAALNRTRGSRTLSLEQRVEALEAQVRRLARAPVETRPSAPAPPEMAAAAPPPRAAPIPPRVPAPAAAHVDTMTLEARIGTRWMTWAGAIAVVFAVGFLLRWTFQSQMIGPGGRVALGIGAGAALLLAGVLTRHRGDIRYLSEGLAGAGLGCLYVAVYAAHQTYGFLGPAAAFAALTAVTSAGILVAVVTRRQGTAILAVIGGLVTPVLVSTERPDERVLLAYLLGLDLFVLGIARFRSWPWLNRLAWAGSVILFLPLLQRNPEAEDPAARLVLLTGLFLVFLAVPVVKPWLDRVAAERADLGLVVANGAAYYGALFATLDRWWPELQAVGAVVLAAVYVAMARAHARRVPEDGAFVEIHLGSAATSLAVALGLWFDGPWLTLAWAAQGAALLAIAPRLARWRLTLAAGLVLMGMAGLRAACLDPLWYRDLPPVANPVFAVGIAVVALMAGTGIRVRDMGEKGDELRSTLWLAAALLLGALLWREPTGFWPGGLLAAEIVGLGFLARAVPDPAFAWAALLVGAAAAVRLFVVDLEAARQASVDLVSRPLAVRLGLCAAWALAAGSLRDETAPPAPATRTALRAAAGFGLLVTLSQAWIWSQRHAIAAAGEAGAGEARWLLQVGLSVLWTLYAAAALGWGFVRSLPAVRYGALALFGLTVAKVFLVDMANVGAAYRVLSFLVLGVVLLAVSYLYQRRA